MKNGRKRAFLANLLFTDLSRVGLGWVGLGWVGPWIVTLDGFNTIIMRFPTRLLPNQRVGSCYGRVLVAKKMIGL